jgi:propanol-preferring alcohol dehydrogenase
MRAMTLTRVGAPESAPLAFRDIPEPVPGPGQVKVRVAVCGVCRTDLHVVEGDLRAGKPDLVPGHQVVGEVDALGAGVEEFHIGDKVGVTWLHSTCGRCEFCLSGRENLCDFARFTGLDADGGYAEAMVVPAENAFRLPEGLDPMQAAPLLCAGVIGWRSMRISGIRPGEVLGLFGFGASAHLTLQAALRKDIRVHVFTREEDHRRQALALGAAWAGPIDAEPPDPLHAAITFAPAGAVVHAALGRLRKGGTVAVNAVHMDPLPPIPYPMLYHERSLKSVANLTRNDVREFLELAAARPFQAAVNPFPLEEANLALARLKASAFLGSAVLRLRP